MAEIPQILMAQIERGADCWPWTGRTNHDGYGIVYWHGKARRAHRVVYAAHYGEIADGLHVLHRCDNPPCVNPAHLFLGTHGDNMRDMAKKRRQRSKITSRQDHFPAGHCPRGEDASGAKLTERQALEVIGLRAAGRTYASLAAQFGLSYSAIEALLTGRTWRHLPRPVHAGRKVLEEADRG